MFETNKIQEAVELFWRETGVRSDGAAVCCYTLPWEQKLYNKKKAEEILNGCTKEELIDYILYNSCPKKTITSASIPPVTTQSVMTKQVNQFSKTE